MKATPAKPGKVVQASKATNPGATDKAKAGKVNKPVGVAKAVKASIGNSGKKRPKGRKKAESDEDRETPMDSQVDEES